MPTRTHSPLCLIEWPLLTLIDVSRTHCSAPRPRRSRTAHHAGPPHWTRAPTCPLGPRAHPHCRGTGVASPLPPTRPPRHPHSPCPVTHPELRARAPYKHPPSVALPPPSDTPHPTTDSHTRFPLWQPPHTHTHYIASTTLSPSCTHRHTHTHTPPGQQIYSKGSDDNRRPPLPSARRSWLPLSYSAPVVVPVGSTRLLNRPCPWDHSSLSLWFSTDGRVAGCGGATGVRVAGWRASECAGDLWARMCTCVVSVPLSCVYIPGLQPYSKKQKRERIRTISTHTNKKNATCTPQRSLITCGVSGQRTCSKKGLHRLLQKRRPAQHL